MDSAGIEAGRSGPAIAPSIVHDVISGPGHPMPSAVRDDMERRLGWDFGDVRIHTDSRAGRSAEAVSAHAYTVGRHIVFSEGRFDPASVAGRTLLAHELTHAAQHPPGAARPAGALRVSSPAEPAERRAVSVAKGESVTAAAHRSEPTLFRTVALNAVSVDHERVTVPPETGLSFSAVLDPTNATGVTFAVAGDNATLASGTSISSTGAITVDAAQEGGSARVQATQRITAPDGSWTQSTKQAAFVFAAIPTGITSTSAVATSAADRYGGEFTHTFGSPAGGQTALQLSHVNEHFAAASGTTLSLSSPIGPLDITVNDPDAASSGWDLNTSGEMGSPDHVTWETIFSARDFVANASNPNPTNALPQAFTATQDFRNLSFPSETYGATVASTTHRRAFEERNDRIKAVSSANATGINEEVVEDYVGPAIFRRCRATPASIPAATPAPAEGEAPEPTTATIAVDTEGESATPTFSINAPDLGCTIDAAGELTPGTTAGTVTVRAGDADNYDETTVTVTAPPTESTESTSEGASEAE